MVFNHSCWSQHILLISKRWRSQIPCETIDADCFLMIENRKTCFNKKLIPCVWKATLQHTDASSLLLHFYFLEFKKLQFFNTIKQNRKETVPNRLWNEKFYHKFWRQTRNRTSFTAISTRSQRIKASQNECSTNAPPHSTNEKASCRTEN